MYCIVLLQKCFWCIQMYTIYLMRFTKLSLAISFTFATITLIDKTTDQKWQIWKKKNIGSKLYINLYYLKKKLMPTNLIGTIFNLYEWVIHIEYNIQNRYSSNSILLQLVKKEKIFFWCKTIYFNIFRLDLWWCL